MIFPAPMRSECAVLACSGVMVPETNLKRPARTSWWIPLPISPVRCSRWSTGRNPRPGKGHLDDGFHETSVMELMIGCRIPCFAIGKTRSGIMAGWRRVIELTMTDEEIERLTCLCHRRNFGQPGDVARAWPIGAGHVGLAYQREGELVNDDVATEEVFQGKGDLYRDYDKNRYRGTASICIPDVNEGRQAVGVLVATSSRVGRYTQANVQPLRDLAQSMGAILSPRPNVIESSSGE